MSKPHGWRYRSVVVPALIALAICVFLGTAGWYFLAVATAFNCSASQIDCGTAANLWLAAAGVGEWALAATAVVLMAGSRARPPWRRPAALTCLVLIAAAVAWFYLAGRLL
jgi:hypothetical protein